MVHFSTRLLDRVVMVEILDPADNRPVWVAGQVIALFEGRNWTHNCRIELTEGPTSGRVVTRELGYVYFGDSSDVPPGEY